MSTWNIKGVSQPAREVVKLMAARNNQHAGEWLEYIIHKQVEIKKNQILQTKMILQYIKQQQRLQHEFQDRFNWLSDRLIKLQNQLDAYHQQKDSSNEDLLLIQQTVLTKDFERAPTDLQDSIKHVGVDENTNNDDPGNNGTKTILTNHEAKSSASDLVTLRLTESPSDKASDHNFAAANLVLVDNESNFSPARALDEVDHESQQDYVIPISSLERPPSTPSYSSSAPTSHITEKPRIKRMAKTIFLFLLYLMLTGAMVYGLSTGYLQQQLEQYLGHTSAAFEQPHHTNPLAFRSNTPNKHPYRLSFDDRLDRQRPYPQTGQKPRYRCLSCMHSGTQQAIAWHQSIWQ